VLIVKTLLEFQRTTRAQERPPDRPLIRKTLCLMLGGRMPSYCSPSGTSKVPSKYGERAAHKYGTSASARSQRPEYRESQFLKVRSSICAIET